VTISEVKLLIQIENIYQSSAHLIKTERQLKSIIKKWWVIKVQLRCVGMNSKTKNTRHIVQC